MNHNQNIKDLKKFINKNSPLFVLTGAGISTASGIPDYRDTNGEWKYQQPMQFQEFVKHDKSRKRYWARSMRGWSRVDQARSNDAHHAINHLQDKGVISFLATQNVDGLHHKAGSQALELHGNLNRVVCLQCQHYSPRTAYQAQLIKSNHAFSSTMDSIRPDGDADIDEQQIHRFNVPECLNCGGVIKPDVVFFGESVPPRRIEQAMKAVEKANGILVVGSSLMVYSGYRYIKAAFKQNKALAAINLGKTRADDMFEMKISAPCENVLSTLITHESLH
jgi:NAD-dependent SIR2 family protein deacetylase